MAKTTALILLLAVLLCNMHTGDAQPSCGKSDVTAAVLDTDDVVGRQRVYDVKFDTLCSCPMKDVRVWCGLDDSALPLDASKVQVFEGMCVLQQPLVKGRPLYFRYSSLTPVHFRVFNAVPAC